MDLFYFEMYFFFWLLNEGITFNPYILTNPFFTKILE